MAFFIQYQNTSETFASKYNTVRVESEIMWASNTFSIIQTDPSRRTTVENLLRDPWVMKDFESTVVWQSKIEVGTKFKLSDLNHTER